MQSHLDEIRRQEIARLRSELGDLTPRQEEAIEALTKGMVNKIVHSPISHMKNLAQQPDGLKVVETVRRIFNLKDS